MKRICLGAGVVVLCMGGASAQIIPQKKVEEKFFTPLDAMREKHRKAKLTEQEFSDQLWKVRVETMPDEKALGENIVDSESGPFRSRRSVWASETMVRRAAEFGSGKVSREATGPVLQSDRWAASQLPEADFPGKAENDAVLAAVYRYFFNYRKSGFGRDATVYFLGLGPHAADAPPSVLAGLSADSALKKDGVALRPMSSALEVTADALRDRDTGAYGAAFRVDDIGREENGEIKVAAAFSERDGFWFARQLTLRDGGKGWQVVNDESLPVTR